MHCPRCDRQNDETAKFCDACGAPLTTADTAPAFSSAGTAAPMSGPICPACVRSNPAGARFCVYCATPLNQSAPVLTPAWQPTFAGAAPAAAYSMPRPLNVALAIDSNLVLRAIWFFFIGWWLGLIWTIAAWAFNLTLIGLPVGIMMLHAIPQIMTLQPSRHRQAIIGNARVTTQPVQHPLPLRALWFIFVGWWASLLWMVIAWGFSASILLMPIGFWMFNRVPTIMTLAAE